MLSTYCGYAGLITTKNLQVALMNFFAAFLKLLTLVVIAVLSKLAAVVRVNSIAFIIVSFFIVIILVVYSARFLNLQSSIFNFQLFPPVFVVSDAKIGRF